MTVRYNIFLFCLPLLALLVFLLFTFGNKRKKRLLKEFAAERLHPILLQNYSPKKEKLKQTLLIASISLVGFALCAPQWGFKEIERHKKGIDLLFAVDVSKSMLAEDIKPNRLERTKLAILDLLQKLSGHRIGLIAFAGASFLQCPLTLDHNAFIQSLNALDSDTIPIPGTVLDAAFTLAQSVYGTTDNQKLLLLFSDGEDLAETAITGAKKVQEDGMVIYTIGIGSPEGTTIPIKSPKNGNIEFLKDRNGKIVTTVLDEKTLQEIANITKGKYYRFLPNVNVAIERDILKQFPFLKESTENLYTEKVPHERYQIFLLLALLLLMLEMFVNTSRRKERYGISIYYKLSLWIIFYCLLFSHLSARESQGEKFYNAGQFEKALEFYSKSLRKNSENLQLLFNQGTTFLALNRYPESIDALKRSLISAPIELQKEAFYNLGNAYFQNGTTFQQPEKKLSEWEESKKSFQSALDLDVSFKDAEKNLKYVEEEIRKLEEQQKQQTQKDRNNQQDQDQEEQKNDDPQEQESKSEKDPQESEEDNRQDNQQESSPEKEKNEEEKNEDDSSKSEPQNPSAQEENNQKQKNNPQEMQQLTQSQEMSEREALQLLNALEDGEKKLPLKSFQTNASFEKFW